MGRVAKQILELGQNNKTFFFKKEQRKKKNDMPKNFAGNTLNVVTNSMSPGRSFSRSILVEFVFF